MMSCDDFWLIGEFRNNVRLHLTPVLPFDHVARLEKVIISVFSSLKY